MRWGPRFDPFANIGPLGEDSDLNSDDPEPPREPLTPESFNSGWAAARKAQAESWAVAKEIRKHQERVAIEEQEDWERCHALMEARRARQGVYQNTRAGIVRHNDELIGWEGCFCHLDDRGKLKVDEGMWLYIQDKRTRAKADSLEQASTLETTSPPNPRAQRRQRIAKPGRSKQAVRTEAASRSRRGRGSGRTNGGIRKSTIAVDRNRRKRQ